MYANILDYKYVQEKDKKFAPKLKVELKQNFKGTSLYAKKFIKKGSVIAYYKFLVHNYKDFVGVNDEMYAFTIYTKSGRENPNLIGDIYAGSLPKPKGNIPFYAYFSNEPSGNQTSNADIDTNEKNNFKHRQRIRAGDTLIYKLRATRDIYPGEEIVWCYGSAYDRNYQANCDDED